jgi:hypothetical protein
VLEIHNQAVASSKAKKSHAFRLSRRICGRCGKHARNDEEVGYSAQSETLHAEKRKCYMAMSLAPVLHAFSNRLLHPMNTHCPHPNSSPTFLKRWSNPFNPTLTSSRILSPCNAPKPKHNTCSFVTSPSRACRRLVSHRLRWILGCIGVILASCGAYMVSVMARMARRYVSHAERMGANEVENSEGLRSAGREWRIWSSACSMESRSGAVGVWGVL